MKNTTPDREREWALNLKKGLDTFAAKLPLEERRALYNWLEAWVIVREAKAREEERERISQEIRERMGHFDRPDFKLSGVYGVTKKEVYSHAHDDALIWVLNRLSPTPEVTS